jgi:Ca2+-transporting ATPase
MKEAKMPKIGAQPAFAQEASDIAAALDVDPGAGLAADEARRRLKKYGPNKLRKKEQKGLLEILKHQFASVIIWLLSGAAVLSFVLGDIAEGAAIIVVLIINGAIGFFTELRATRSMEALMRIAAIRTRVRRDGKEQKIAAHDLVPGDLVVLAAGDIVTADLRIVAASNLQADESALTGESVPVGKAVTPVADDAALGDRASMAFKGTAITQGSGEGLVVATGMATEIGQISALAQSAEGEAAPLERRLDRLGHRLVWLTLGLAALTVAAGILRGYEIAIMVQTGVALAVAAVPEGLPVVATLSLARGMWRMSERNALITRLSSVETLGATTVILTDKTGTLTENRMAAARYLLAGAEVTVEEGGEAFDLDDKVIDPANDDRLAWALRIGALCNSAELGDGTKDGRAGDPMEIALLSVAKKAGLSRADLLHDHPQKHEHAFDTELKMMATVHGDAEGHVFAVKGAPEAVIAVCTEVLGSSGPDPLDDAGRKEWGDRNAKAAGDGLRLLALAMKRAAPDAEPYEALTLVGLVGLRDPIREDVAHAIAASRSAGVRVVMLTGDHAETARSIAQSAGLADGEVTVIEGKDIEGIDAGEADAGLRKRVLAADVFARVAPETKLTLVALFQKAGHVVAMTGDGVNDAPALKKADIGIAMGQRGTEVAKEAAHMVLRDDSFATIIAAMRQGRVIFGNIRKFVIYLMSCNVSEALVVAIAIAGGLPAPLLPLQILYLNLVTDIFPAFALGLGRGDDNVMNRPPRDPREAIVTRDHWLLMSALGASITLATLGAFGLSLFWLGLDNGAAVTVAFTTLAVGQLWNVFNMRDPEAGLIRNDVSRNPYVWGAIALSLGLIGLALFLPPLADLLKLASPGWAGLALASAASILPLVFGQLWIIWRFRRSGSAR